MIKAAAVPKKARMPVRRAVVRDSCFTHASMTAPGTTSIQVGSGSRAGVAARSITPKRKLGSGRAGFDALRFLAWPSEERGATSGGQGRQQKFFMAGDNIGRNPEKKGGRGIEIAGPETEAEPRVK